MQSTEAGREMAALISASGRTLEQVVNDILDVCRIEDGRLAIEAAGFDLGRCLAQAVDLHVEAASAKGVRLIREIDDSVAGFWIGDSVRITQIVANLVGNAVKFTAEGEVRFTARARGGRVRLSVADTGIGFDRETRKRLFHRFEQADLTITRRFGGAGLGLAISASLTEMMGGSIATRSVPGKGSIFAVSLPLERADEPVAAELPAAPSAVEGGRPLRVLLAEDHPANRQVVSMILATLGVDLTAVDNGEAALNAAKAGRFDVILMDVQMPEMDGLTATRLLRAHEAVTGLARTPVISLTANAMPEHIEASLAAGADRHLAKPIRPDVLIEAVVELTNGGSGALEAAA
jgi:CheY-like chemotaxis protein/anti-sigma regulatory factor (Ser/Thr protein kinase)